MKMENLTTTVLPTTGNHSYERPFDETGTIVSAFIILSFLVIGLVGNGLTIAVIIAYRTLNENVFMRFILSLCVSDLLSALISWIFLYRRTWGFDVWEPLPSVFCKIYWATDIMTSFVTALHILSFAILRFISIRFPMFYDKVKLSHGNIWIVSMWIICFASGFIPCWLIFGSATRDRYSSAQDARWPACTVLEDQLENYTLFQKITYPLFLYIPTIGVLIVCLLIVYIVNKKSEISEKISRKCKKRKKQEKQAVLQLLLIIMSFLLGYLPFTAYEFWSVQDFIINTRYYQLFDYWFGMTEYIFLRFSECLNPLFYNLGSGKVRKHTKMFIKEKILCCIKWKKPLAFGTVRSRVLSASSDRLSTTGTNMGV